MCSFLFVFMLLFELIISEKGNIVEIDRVIEVAEESLYGKSMVLELSAYDLSDYQRGIVAGRISMLNFVKNMLDTQEDINEDDII